MPDLCTAGLVVLLTTWFTLSVLNQVGRSRFPGLERADLWQLLPRWNFFAPNPGMHDYYLMYRDKSQAGEPGGWHLLQPKHYRPWMSCVWNPGKVQNKVVADLVQMLAGYDADVRQNPAVMLSLPYLVWLKMTIEAPRADDATLRQFVLAQKQGLIATDPLTPILVSDFHTFE
jgi:hypothetical protein